MAGTAHANAILTHTSGLVKIGVFDEGHLNVPGGAPSVTGTTAVGVRFIPPVQVDEYEVTSHGCLCEGWGVDYNGVTSGYANIDGSGGVFNIISPALVEDGVSATSVGTVGDVEVRHEFIPSPATDNLYEVIVTITALESDVTDVQYRRTMDWDTVPTRFNEFVTIGGTAVATAVLGASNDGFCSSDPLSPLQCGGVSFPTLDDFVDLGPDDHGANFDFGFGDLAAGESVTFSIFYGGADDVAEAFAVMAAAEIEVFSLGRSGTDVEGDGFMTQPVHSRRPNIFGFKGVGGRPVDEVPEPATFALMGLGLLAIGAAR